jgi:nucleoside-diphosphate-sugar epimerase
MSGVAIIGAAGFLGGHLVHGFEARGARVLPLVRVVDEGSPVGARTLGEAIDTPTLAADLDAAVYAAAGRGDEQRSVEIDRVERAMRMTASAGIPRFVLVSSTSVYGFPARLPVTEDHPYAPRTSQAAVKVEVEMRARRVARESRLRLVIVRPSVVYGPGTRGGLLDRMASAIQLGVLVGPGDNLVHLTHVDDVVEGTWLASTLADADDDHFIVAGPSSTTLASLCDLVARAIDRPPPSVRVPASVARAVATVVDVALHRGVIPARRRSVPPIRHEQLDEMTLSIAFDTAKARRRLGFAPRVGYDEGVARTLLGQWPDVAREGASP